MALLKLIAHWPRGARSLKCWEALGIVVVALGDGSDDEVTKGRGVQHESTATGLDSGGLVRTPGDGDLHGWTAVDVLPLDGMQEVRGSNPRSSTAGQGCNSNDKPMSSHLSRAIGRGKIRPSDGLLISIRVKLGQVGRTSSAFVMCRRS
jgi:hypothetical protein